MAFKMKEFSGFKQDIFGDSELYTKNKNYHPKKYETWESWKSRTDENWESAGTDHARILEKNSYYDPKVGLFVEPTPIIRKK